MSNALKVAIVGGGSGYSRAPFHDRKWECWGLNACWGKFEQAEKDFTRWFELHRRSFLLWEHGAGANENYEHIRWLRSLQSLPVYVQEPGEWSDVAMARAYPFKAVQALSKRYANYHCCSIDWMIAFAITEGAKEIALYGVEQDHTAEPIGSRACVEFWSGFATARGIDVWSDDGSTFRMAQLVYRATPYAFEPSWLPWANDDSHSTLNLKSRFLSDVVQHGTKSHFAKAVQAITKGNGG